jgi:hypothetical protein
MYGLKGRVVAALSISGPSSRLDSRRIPTLLPHLKRISAVISSALAAQENGFHPKKSSMQKIVTERKKS